MISATTSCSIRLQARVSRRRQAHCQAEAGCSIVHADVRDQHAAQLNPRRAPANAARASLHRTVNCWLRGGSACRLQVHRRRVPGASDRCQCGVPGTGVGLGQRHEHVVTAGRRRLMMARVPSRPPVAACRTDDVRVPLSMISTACADAEQAGPRVRACAAAASASRCSQPVAGAAESAGVQADAGLQAVIEDPG